MIDLLLRAGREQHGQHRALLVINNLDHPFTASQKLGRQARSIVRERHAVTMGGDLAP